MFLVIFGCSTLLNTIFDFAGKQSQQNTVKNTNFHEFGLESDSQNVMFADFGIETNNIIRKPLSMMAILNSYLNNRDASHRSSQKWAKDKSSILGDSFWRSSNFSTYNKYKQCFEEWLSEMKENHISFEPFRPDKSSVDALDIVVGITPHYGFLSKKGCDYIDKKLSDNIGKISANLNPLQSFLELFYITLKEICENKLKL